MLPTYYFIYVFWKFFLTAFCDGHIFLIYKTAFRDPLNQYDLQTCFIQTTSVSNIHFIFNPMIVKKKNCLITLW